MSPIFPHKVMNIIMILMTMPLCFFLIGIYLLHAKLNSHCKACSYKKKNHEKGKTYGKFAYKEPIVEKCLC